MRARDDEIEIIISWLVFEMSERDSCKVFQSIDVDGPLK